MKYEELICPNCRKETLHRVRNKYGLGDKGKPYLKNQIKHCLTCNFYHGYKEKRTRAERKEETMVSLR